jgi:hypothetical protein
MNQHGVGSLRTHEMSGCFSLASRHCVGCSEGVQRTTDNAEPPREFRLEF